MLDRCIAIRDACVDSYPLVGRQVGYAGVRQAQAMPEAQFTVARLKAGRLDTDVRQAQAFRPACRRALQVCQAFRLDCKSGPQAR